MFAPVNQRCVIQIAKKKAPFPHVRKAPYVKWYMKKGRGKSIPH